MNTSTGNRLQQRCQPPRPRRRAFGPDTFAFPRKESRILEEEGFAATMIDTCNSDAVYRTNAVRRKDVTCMRLPHHCDPLAWQGRN